MTAAGFSATRNCARSSRTTCSTMPEPDMHIIDSHFHWWPRSVSDQLCKRKTYPRAEVNERGGYTYLRQDGGDYILNSWTDWFDLDDQLAHMDRLGHQVDVVCSIG